MNRRDFLRGVAGTGAAVTLASALSPSTSTQTTAMAQPAPGPAPGPAPAPAAPSAGVKPPNVIVVIVDDQGSIDAGCYGATDLVTPNLDALAARGVRLTQFYSGAPVCSPSRAALLTGRYPFRAGLTTNAASRRDGAAGLPPRETTMARMFQTAGYATGHVGKWHLGYTRDMMPNARGFDYSFGHMGGCIDNYSHFFYWVGPNVHDLYRNGQEVFETGRFFPDLMVEEATRFITAHQDGPFFLYFALNLPHYPYQPTPQWRERFKDLPHPRNLYAGWMAMLDERLGALLRHVDELGLRERTIVVYQSDHGHSTEERAHFGGGNSGPYRGAKFSMFEGGIRVPGLIAWPGHLPAGAVRGQVVSSCDWLPTLAELCGVKVLNPDLDGRSAVKVLHAADAPSAHDVLHWHESVAATPGAAPGAAPGAGAGAGKSDRWAVRQGDWKLLANVWDTTRNDKGPERIPLFLANLSEDVGEKKDYAQDRPEVVERLRGLHEEWVRKA